MYKRFGILAIILTLAAGLLAGLAPGITMAAGDISVVSSTVTPQFPDALTFNIKATSGASIVDVRLHFTVERDSFASVVTEEKLSFTAATSIAAAYEWDMRQSGGLPTGTVVDFWWTITDNSGKTLTTTEQKVSFDDTRYTWKSITQNNITIHWYSGGAALAQTLMDTALQGLVSLKASTGASLSRPVSIYIYDNSNDMLGAMIFAQDWTGGATYPSYSTIVLGVNSSNLDWGEGALVHELAHMVNYQMTSNPYNDLPTWLDEGLAMYAEGELDSSFQMSLIVALADDSLFTVRSMSSPFSTDATLSYQEYAESYSIIDFLISEYGQAKMTALLGVFHQGSTYDGALMEVYGFDMDGLYAKWLPFATQKYFTSGTGATA